jgi:uncharacterized membrane protein
MALEVVNLVLAAYMAGVGWIVQLVLYPLFAQVGAAEWPAYHAMHSRRITPVVAPAMLAHPVVALALLVSRPGVLAAVNVVLVVGLLVVTATVFAREHGRLTDVARLGRWNWGRTVGWTASCGVALWLVLTA